MIGLAAKIPLYVSFRATGTPRMMPFNLTISVSYKCNSRCRTCNVWKRKADDLSAAEYDKIFSSIGKGVFWVTFSGGEPFLRKDLGTIIASAYGRCRPKIINIPTNGLLGRLVSEKSAQIARACPDSEVVVNLSLDGVGKKHDNIRGVPGNFNRAMEAYQALRELRLPNLSVGVHMVISRFNVEDVPEFCDFVLDELKPDSYISEVAEERVELGTMGAGITPKARDYAKAADYIKMRTGKKSAKKVSRFTKAFRMNYYEYAKEVLRSKRQPIPCYAGFASAQISPEGDVWGCCIRAEPLGSLRQSGYDFRKIWFSERADRFRQSVKAGECACPLANAYYSSAVCDPITTVNVLSRLGNLSP